MTVLEREAQFKEILTANSLDREFIRNNSDYVKMELHTRARNSEFHYDLTLLLTKMYKDSQTVSIIILFITNSDIKTRIHGIDLAHHIAKSHFQFNELFFEKITANLYYRDQDLLRATLDYLSLYYDIEKVFPLVISQFVYTTNESVQIQFVQWILSNLPMLGLEIFKYLGSLIELGQRLCQNRVTRPIAIQLLLQTINKAHPRSQEYYTDILCHMADLYLQDPTSWQDTRGIVEIIKESKVAELDFRELKSLNAFKIWFEQINP